jgi:hypothetical protein
MFREGAEKVMPSLPAVLSIALLCGCAAAQSPAAARRTDPDCSFRSAATCWTVAGRFPPRRADTAAPKPHDIRNLSPAVLASEADSARGSR